MKARIVKTSYLSRLFKLNLHEVFQYTFKAESTVRTWQNARGLFLVVVDINLFNGVLHKGKALKRQI